MYKIMYCGGDIMAKWPELAFENRLKEKGIHQSQDTIFSFNNKRGFIFFPDNF